RKGLGEGTRSTSWIWMDSGGDLIDQEALEEGIRVEWCKTHARAERWSEEVVLLEEEMRHCLVTLDVKAKEWEQWAYYDGPLLVGADEEHREGVAAFAASQAAVMCRIASQFTVSW
ncbi:hypothetical protein BT96DRAFT_770809, partial [Gymnopus androsaceus JB14]